MGGLARIELGWPLCGCRHGGDPLAVGSGEAWLEEQEGGGGLGRGLGSRGLGSLGRIWGQEAESQCPTGEVETLKGPRSGDGVGGSLWGRGSPVRELGTGWGRGRGREAHWFTLVVPRRPPIFMARWKVAEAWSGEAALGGQLQQLLSVDEERLQLPLGPHFLILVKPPGVSLNH